MFLFLRAFALLLAVTWLPLPASAQTQIDTGTSQDIFVLGTCKTITNACSANIMAPTFDVTQFDAIPSSFGLAGCGTATPCVGGGRTYGHIALGLYNSCFLNASGGAYCTGYNDNYNGGTGSTTDVSILTPVAGGHTFTQILGTGNGGCGLRTDGIILCWGPNGNWGDNGQTAQNTAVGATTVPTAIYGSGTDRWLSLAKAARPPHYGCAIKNDQTAHCWGTNGAGQLGDGTTTERLIPTPVSGGYTWTRLALAPGATSNANTITTCGIRTDGAMMCWGENGYGQLGDGTTTRRTSPVLIPGGYTWSDLSVGEGWVCGVRTDNILMCWGRNNAGQLGDGTNVQRGTPTLVSGSYTWDQVTAGAETTCGIRTNGIGMCWGSSSHGQKGMASNPTPYLPRAIDGGYYWKELSTGFSRTTCGVTTNHKLYCWGYCDYSTCTSATGMTSTPTFISSGY